MEQIGIVTRFIDDFDSPATQVVVDPVMGDYGRPYATYTSAMCEGMKALAVRADVLTPNLTEACILAEKPYDPHMGVDGALALARDLADLGPSRVAVTGIAEGDRLVNACFERGRGSFVVRNRRLGEDRSGTGDVFSAVIAADAVNGVDFEESVCRASCFVGRCIERSIELDLPLTDGVCFEEVLPALERTPRSDA
jgi:pyridoxine kinase